MTNLLGMGLFVWVVFIVVLLGKLGGVNLHPQNLHIMYYYDVNKLWFGFHMGGGAFIVLQFY